MTHMKNPRDRENSSFRRIRIIMHREIRKKKTRNDSSSKVIFIFTQLNNSSIWYHFTIFVTELLTGS